MCFFLILPEEGGEVGEAVFAFGSAFAAEVGEGCQEVVMSGEKFVFGACLDFVRPANNHGALPAALVTTAFEPGSAAGTVEDVSCFGGAPFSIREVAFLSVGEDLISVFGFRSVVEFVSIVGSEEDDGVVIKALFLEFSHDEADVIV